MANRNFKYDREKVGKLFAHNKTNVLLITSDGQCFLEKNKSFCVNHANGTKQDWMTLTKEQYDLDGKEKPKADKTTAADKTAATGKPVAGKVTAAAEPTAEEKIEAAKAEVTKHEGIVAVKQSVLDKAEGSKRGLAQGALNKATTALEKAQSDLAALVPEADKDQDKDLDEEK